MTTAGHASLPTIDSPDLPIPSFLLAFAVSCLRREQDDKEHEDLHSSTEENKETIIINTNESSPEKNVNPDIIVATGGAVTTFVRLVQDVR